MSLSRQITVILLCACSALSLALGWTMFDQTRAALGARQQVLAQEVAQSLAKSLAGIAPAPVTVVGEPGSAQPVLGGDPQIDSRLDQAFDSADLQEITLRRADQTILAQRRALSAPGEVPAWFVRLCALAPPTLHASWSRAGGGPVDIAVVAASTDLLSVWWQAARQTAMVATAALLLVLVLSALWLAATLRPLRALGAQARAISDREYPVSEALPRDPDLRSIAQALNRLSGKMRSLFDAHTEAMNRLRAETYRDVLTGLANRRYFDLRLQQLLGAADGANSGALLLIALDDFQGINQRLGFAAGDELLRTAANALELCAREAPEFEHFVARLSGATFALLLSNAAEQDAAACAQRLVTAWGRLHLPMPLMGQAPTRGLGHIGIAMVRHQSATQLLAEADTALRAAQGKGPDAWHLHDPRGDRSVEYSATRWTEFLQDVIRTKNIILHLQPVLDSANHRTILQYETLLRVVGEDGQLIPAVVFVPMARRLGLIQQLDQLVVEEVLARIRQDRYGRIAIAVNLFGSTIQDASFMRWLETALQADPGAARRMCFEVTEQAALDDLAAMRALVALAHQAGARVGLDHVGRGFASFGYLATVKLDYLKIDGSFIRAIDSQRDNQFLVESICKVAHGLDLQVIAEAVENEQEWAMLTTLKLDGVQGYGVGMPAEI